jgi:hypothetical protein
MPVFEKQEEKRLKPTSRRAMRIQTEQVTAARSR